MDRNAAVLRVVHGLIWRNERMGLFLGGLVEEEEEEEERGGLGSSFSNAVREVFSWLREVVGVGSDASSDFTKLMRCMDKYAAGVEKGCSRVISLDEIIREHLELARDAMQTVKHIFANDASLRVEDREYILWN